MNRERCNSITRRLIDHVCNDTTDLVDEPWIEPAEHFIDQERFEAEREQFFLDTPQVIGFACQVAEPGSYFTADVAGMPVVVTRDGDGVLRAFLNVCTHRGAKVASGCGKQQRLVCHFHGWSYGLDGRLVARGRAADFEPDAIDTALQPLPVSDNAGLLVAGLRPGIGPLRVQHFLDDMAPDLAGLGLEKMVHVGSDRFEVEANWKLVVNLSHEGYHFQTLHRDSLAPMMTGHCVYDEFGLHTRWAFPLRGIETLREKKEADWPAFPPAAMNHTLFPGTVVVVNHGNAQMIRVEPGHEPGASIVHFSSVALSQEDRSRAEEGARATHEFGRRIFETEDLPAAVECQRGIESGRRPVVVGRNEPVVQIWHRRWRDELEAP